MKLILLFLFFCFTFSYLPGLDQKLYSEGDAVEVKTRKLYSKKDLPFPFYSLKFCQPNPIVDSANSLGEVLFGDRIENSLYKIEMKKSFKCKKLTDVQSANCPKEILPQDIKDFSQKIQDDYEAQLIIDNLPVANLQRLGNCGSLPKYSVEQSYTRADGFPIGCRDEKNQFFINNHLTFKLKYHLNQQTKRFSIVGAAVIPTSIKHNPDSCKLDQELPNLPNQELNTQTKNIEWTYGVEWEESDIRWASRWDAYLNIGNSEDYKVHWFSIINSLMIIFFLTGMVAMIMLRALHKDIALYNTDMGEDPTDETGWKLVHGDVFRKPSYSTLLAIVNGSGIQLFGMFLITIIFAVLGFISPSNRGAIASVMLLLFAFMGIFAGYTTLRLYKMFEGEYWKTVSLLTSIFFPGVVFTIFILINFIIFVSSKSSLAVPFTYLLLLLAIWIGITLPMVLLGGYFGFSKDILTNPTNVHKIPRQIPNQAWYISPPFSFFMGGILPFGAVFIELYFIMSSIWLNKYYFVFGFLFIVFFILIITCSEITIVMIYFQLCNADYRWHWRSFLTSGFSAFYLFIYSAFYYFTKLSNSQHIVMSLVYFSYMSIVSFFFFILTGTIGFFACYWFIRVIYASIKVD